MSSRAASTKGKQTHVQRTIKVGAGLVDRTTFQEYDIRDNTSVFEAANTASNEVVNAVYQRFGVKRPDEDDQTAESWIFPTGADYASPISSLPYPPSGSDVPRLMVLVKLPTETPMLDRVLNANKENNNGGTGEGLAQLMAEFRTMKKDMSGMMTSHDRLQGSYDRLQASHDQLQGSYDRLQASHDRLEASNDQLKADNDRLNAEVRRLNTSNNQLSAEVQRLNNSNIELRAKVVQLEDDHESKVSSISSDVTRLQTNLDEAKNELMQSINTTTPLFLRILVDKARKKVLKETEFRVWHDYHKNFPTQDALRRDIQRLTSLSQDFAIFISDPKTSVRKKGNYAAHNADKADIQRAVERTKASRDLLDLTLQYVFPIGQAEDDDEDKVEDGDDEYSEDDEAV